MIIKPVLDSLQIMDVSAISFLSGCTVLSMSCYSVLKSFAAKEKDVELHVGSFLAIGAVLGGIIGKNLFSKLYELAANKDYVGGYQGILLAFVTLMTFFYEYQRNKWKTHTYNHFLVCILVGFLLGMMSSFLGIGGGPMNLVVLHYFFSMDSKKAAQNSLYIILISQLASFLTMWFSGSIPSVNPIWLAVMIFGGISGGIVGRRVKKRISSEQLGRKFLLIILGIFALSVFNAVKYFL